MSDKHWVDDSIVMANSWPANVIYGPNRIGPAVYVPGNEKARHRAEAIARLLDREVYVLLEWKRGPYRTEVVEVELFLTEAKREEYARLRIGQVLQQDLFDPVRGLVESFLERGFLGDAVAQCCAAMACKRWLELWPSPLRVND